MKFFGQADPRPFRHLSAVFEAVSSGSTDCGVVPVENSQAGSINETYDLLLEYDLNIVGEVYLKVTHCLLALPGETIKDIQKIYSHPQALAQCEEFLSSLGAELIPTYDTAGSAKMLKEQGLRNSSAIASKRVSQIYGMEVLAEGIETNPQNFTRFFVISGRESPRSQESRVQSPESRVTGRGTPDSRLQTPDFREGDSRAKRLQSEASPESKTSLIFRTKNIPGALYQSLGAFANRGINLTKLESRPAKDTPWEYIFYVDFEGHVDDEICREAVEELQSTCLFLKILGSYPKTR